MAAAWPVAWWSLDAADQLGIVAVELVLGERRGGERCLQALAPGAVGVARQGAPRAQAVELDLAREPELAGGGRCRRVRRGHRCHDGRIDLVGLAGQRD